MVERFFLSVTKEQIFWIGVRILHVHRCPYIYEFPICGCLVMNAGVLLVEPESGGCLPSNDIWSVPALRKTLAILKHTQCLPGAHLK